jgi:hypothetical protein
VETPRRRATDQDRWVRLRAWVTLHAWNRDSRRDLWLTIISVVVLFTAWATYDHVSEIQDTRRDAIYESCLLDERANDVLRAILIESIRIRKDAPPPPGQLTYEEARRLSEELMRPLGGLKRLTAAERSAKCERQAVRYTRISH